MKRIRAGVGAVAAGIAIGVLPACEKVNSVASSVSPCFRVLPQARASVSGQGTLVDLARVSRAALPRLPGFPLRRRTARPTSTSTPGTTIAGQGDVCLVAYKGTFDPARITTLVGPLRSGRYAIVVVGIRSQRVRAVTLVDTLPHPFHNR